MKIIQKIAWFLVADPEVDGETHCFPVEDTSKIPEIFLRILWGSGGLYCYGCPKFQYNF
jgi:hypothetical protein